MKLLLRLVCGFLLLLAPVVAKGAGEGERLVAAAREQVGVTRSYDGAYVSLRYPGGDVPVESGVCTDVVVRAVRSAFGFDLQVAVHEDMRGNFRKYPQRWKLKGPDRNIDHRRVPNLRTYFTRHHQSLPVSNDPGAYLPGDLVTSTLPGNLPHIMIVSDQKTSEGVPLVVHNIGRGAQEEDALFAYPLNGHYRLRYDQADRAKP